MLEKMIFQSQEEEVDFEKYRQLKGDDLYFQIFRILSEKTPKVKYVTVRAYIRYDKNLRDMLYIYLATLEEYCKARLLHSFDVCVPKKYQWHCYKELMKNLVPRENEQSTLYYGFQPDFGDLMHICSEKEVYKIESSDQKAIKILRNQTMHHAMILFGNAKTEVELLEHFNTLEKQLNALVNALPPEYRNGFLDDIVKLNENSVHGTKHLSKFGLEVYNGRLCVKK